MGPCQTILRRSHPDKESSVVARLAVPTGFERSFAQLLCGRPELRHLLREPGSLRLRERGEGGGKLSLTRQLDQCRGVGVLELRPFAVERFAAHEDPRQRVVVMLRDRVEGMVVAASAGQRESEHRLRGHIDLLIDEVHLKLSRVAGVECLGAECEKAGGDDFLGLIRRAVMIEQVAGKLSPEECVVGHVGVERIDHPIAIPPGVRIGNVRLFAS